MEQNKTKAKKVLHDPALMRPNVFLPGVYYKEGQPMGMFYKDKNGVYRSCRTGSTSALQKEQQRMSAALRDLTSGLSGVIRACAYYDNEESREQRRKWCNNLLQHFSEKIKEKYQVKKAFMLAHKKNKKKE